MSKNPQIVISKKHKLPVEVLIEENGEQAKVDLEKFFSAIYLNLNFLEFINIKLELWFPKIFSNHRELRHLISEVMLDIKG